VDCGGLLRVCNGPCTIENLNLKEREFPAGSENRLLRTRLDEITNSYEGKNCTNCNTAQTKCNEVFLFYSLCMVEKNEPPSGRGARHERAGRFAPS
jgi:hypothetical protein